jgi:hypothetical protein
MPRPLRLACAVSSALVVSACHDSTTNPEDTLRDLARARARWEARGPDSYAVTQSRVCFCPSPFQWTVVVVGGEPSFVTSVIDVGSSEDPRAMDAQALESSLSVEQAFDWIEDRVRTADRLDVSFDEQLGFPTHIYYDGSLQAADDEIERTFADIVETGACTQIGCFDGFALTMRPSGSWFPDGNYFVRVTPLGYAQQTCCFSVRGGTVSGCKSPCALPVVSFDPPAVTLHFLVEDVMLDVVIERAGSVIAGEQVDPALERVQPNGPLCAPVCYQARHEMVIP